MMSPHDARGMLRAANRRYRRARKAAAARASGRFYYGHRLMLCDFRPEDRTRLHELANEAQARALQLFKVLPPVRFTIRFCDGHEPVPVQSADPTPYRKDIPGTWNT